MKKLMTLAAALALTGAALYGNAVFADEPAPAPAPSQQAEAQKPAPEPTEAQASQNTQRDLKMPFIIRRPLPKEQRAEKEQAENPKPAVQLPEGKIPEKSQTPGVKRPLKDWEKKYYEEHPDALKQDQEKNEPPEGKKRHNNDDEYYNWHRL